MRFLKLSGFISFLLIVFLLSACAQPKALVYTGIENFRVHKADLKSITLVVDLRLYNPNNYGLSLKNGDLDAFINERPLGKAIIDERVVIPAKDSFLLPVTIVADISNIFQNALEALASKEVMVRLDGTVRGGKGGIFLSIPVHYSGRQSIHL